MCSFQTSWYKDFPIIEYSKVMTLFTVYVASISHPFQESMKMLLKVDLLILRKHGEIVSHKF